MKLNTLTLTAVHGLLLIALLIACGKHSGGHLDPEREFLWTYEAWGNQFHYEREKDFAWKDGSNWKDGISSTPPPLPIPAGEPPSTVMTCAQEEVINMVAVPDGAGPYESREFPDPKLDWETNFSMIVWGEDYPQAGDWRAKDPFDKRCKPHR